MGKQQGVKPGDFRVLGDSTLIGISGLTDPKANLDKFKAQDEPVIQFFAAGLKGVNAQGMDSKYTSADILNPAKGTGQCKNKSPLGCALDAKPAIVLIDVGRNDIAAKIPLNQFSASLTSAVNAAIKRGLIPVLVTAVGVANPADAPQLTLYNTAIYNVAKTANIPLFNLYAIRAEYPALINPTIAELTAGPKKVTDLSPAGLQFGVNVATLHTLELLSALKNTIPLP